ncbi:MAG: hypothetical protein FWB97_09680 [Oscillospiraceae bacterium]|nr:hypothetical protein [Oscillospiraceae bacterium]
MKKIMNLTTSRFDTGRYSDNADLKSFYKEFGFDGLEVTLYDDDKEKIVLADDIIGLHMRYFSSWMDLWMGDEQRLLDEFGNFDAVRQTFGGTSGKALTQAFLENLNALPPSASPEYLVFHISECLLAESIYRRFHYSSEAVIDAAIKLVDSFSEAVCGVLLFENLWYSGLDMLEPRLTYRLLEGVKYRNVGIMLDIGHLLHTNMQLRTIDEGVEYIHKILDQYSDLSFIKGIHLHQSLSGEYAGNLMRTWLPSESSYADRTSQVLSHIFKIDAHQPFASGRINELIERVRPDYLVIEQISSDRSEHARNLSEQLRFLEK